MARTAGTRGAGRVLERERVDGLLEIDSGRVVLEPHGVDAPRPDAIAPAPRSGALPLLLLEPGSDDPAMEFGIAGLRGASALGFQTGAGRAAIASANPIA